MADIATTVREIFSQMPKQINAEAAKGIDALIQFHLTGEGGGDWYVEIRDGKCTVSEGTHDSPSVTMTASAADYVDMLTGKLNGQMAFMSGRLKISGDMGLAGRMQELFRNPLS